MIYTIKYKTLDGCVEHVTAMYFFNTVCPYYKMQDDSLRWGMLSEMDEDAV